MPKTLKSLDRPALCKVSSLTTEVYIRSIEVQRGMTEVQRAHPSSKKHSQSQRNQNRATNLLSKNSVYWQPKLEFGLLKLRKFTTEVVKTSTNAKTQVTRISIH